MAHTCHCQVAIGRVPDVPNLAGESSIYLTGEFIAYRPVERDHPQMSIIAEALSNKQIAGLAFWHTVPEFF